MTGQSWKDSGGVRESLYVDTLRSEPALPSHVPVEADRGAPGAWVKLRLVWEVCSGARRIELSFNNGPTELKDAAGYPGRRTIQAPWAGVFIRAVRARQRACIHCSLTDREVCVVEMAWDADFFPIGKN